MNTAVYKKLTAHMNHMSHINKKELATFRYIDVVKHRLPVDYRRTDVYTCHSDI